MPNATHECPRCHAEVFEGAHHCVQCGGRLDGRTQTPSKLLAARPSGGYSMAGTTAPKRPEPTHPSLRDTLRVGRGSRRPPG